MRAFTCCSIKYQVARASTLVLAVTTRVLVVGALVLVVITVADRALQHGDGGMHLYHWRLQIDTLNTDAQWRPVNSWSPLFVVSDFHGPQYIYGRVNFLFSYAHVIGG